MICPKCKVGRTRGKKITMTLERAGVEVVFKNVPAQVCDTCNGEFVTEATSAQMLRLADEATAEGIRAQVGGLAA